MWLSQAVCAACGVQFKKQMGVTWDGEWPFKNHIEPVRPSPLQ